MTDTTQPPDLPSAQDDRAARGRQADAVYYQRNKRHVKARVAQYQRVNRLAVNAYHVEWRKRLRAETIAAYGGACDCCGEAEPSFLTIDHIDGNGNAHRKEVVGAARRGGERFYSWLKREGWPPGYRVRCWNCNSGAHLNGGVCPHEEARAACLVTVIPYTGTTQSAGVDGIGRSRGGPSTSGGAPTAGAFTQRI